MTLEEIHEDSAPMDEHGIVHGFTADALANDPTLCNDIPLRYFECPNCERKICYCMGHDDCDLCDECCANDHRLMTTVRT